MFGYQNGGVKMYIHFKMLTIIIVGVHNHKYHHVVQYNAILWYHKIVSTIVVPLLENDMIIMGSYISNNLGLFVSSNGPLEKDENKRILLI